VELELLFNELSWQRPAPSVDQARECAERFVLAMREAMYRGVKRVVRSTLDLQQLELGPAYYWWHWRMDPAVRLELRQYFRSVATKYPALLDEAEVEREMHSCDYFHDGRRAVGLGIACRIDSLALSMLSSNVWNTPTLVLEVHELRDDEIEQHAEEVRHASHPEHVRNTHSDWIKRRLASFVEDGAELWKRSSQFFPNLVFCEAVAEQMNELPTIAIPSVMRGLFHLNDYARDWTSGGFEPRKVQCVVSPESPSTMREFAEDRTFLCPDGRSLTFSWHAKPGSSWRVYFDPTVGPRRLLVGYVGKHLGTAKYR
jgi:hypothetical protein